MFKIEYEIERNRNEFILKHIRKLQSYRKDHGKDGENKITESIVK
jgi:hypothetical protein